MGRNRTISCQNCSKQMRSDKVIAHRQICGRLAKYLTEKCRICQKIMIKSNISRHMKRHDNHVFLTLKEDQSNYEKLAETGKIVQEHVEKENINPKSLRKEYILALNVHHNEDQEEKVIILKPWQTKLLELMEPSERKIIWIRGCRGNFPNMAHLASYCCSVVIFSSQESKLSGLQLYNFLNMPTCLFGCNSL